jgi:integrase/recombinase XerD
VLSLEQVARVVAAQSRLLFVLLFTTGMLIGQALGLRHEDVRLWKRELAIVPREDNAYGARGKRGSGVLPLTEEAARLYLLYMEHEYGLLDSDYVFVNLWGGERGRPLNYAAVSRLVARTRKRIGSRNGGAIRRIALAGIGASVHRAAAGHADGATRSRPVR